MNEIHVWIILECIYWFINPTENGFDTKNKDLLARISIRPKYFKYNALLKNQQAVKYLVSAC